MGNHHAGLKPESGPASDGRPRTRSATGPGAEVILTGWRRELVTRRRSQESNAKALIIGAVKGSAEEARMRGWSKESTEVETDSGTEADADAERVERDPTESEAFIMENIIS